MWTVDSADLTCAKDARHAISNVTVLDTSRFLIRGKAGANDDLFAEGDPIKKLDTYNGAMHTITRWFAIGRQITAIELVHAA